MKETYCYQLVRAHLKPLGGWLFRPPDLGIRYSKERPDFIYIVNGMPVIIEVKVKRTRRAWTIRDMRPEQRAYYEDIARTSGALVQIWIYDERVRHKNGSPDAIWFFGDGVWASVFPG